MSTGVCSAVADEVRRDIGGLGPSHAAAQEVTANAWGAGLMRRESVLDQTDDTSPSRLLSCSASPVYRADQCAPGDLKVVIDDAGVTGAPPPREPTLLVVGTRPGPSADRAFPDRGLPCGYPRRNAGPRARGRGPPLPTMTSVDVARSVLPGRGGRPGCVADSAQRPRRVAFAQLPGTSWAV